MKKILLIFLSFIALNVSAQPFGNEWIQNYNQQYFKFKIADDGIYRLDYNTITAAGIPISSINPKNLQVFARGEEVPLYVKGEEDEIFNSNDYIEFYGERNDGRLEVGLFSSAEAHTNPNYSLYNDTINYFLTWNNSENNSRVLIENDQGFNQYTPADWIWKKERIDYINNYYPGELDGYGVSVSFFTAGEGWMSPRFGFPSGAGNLDQNIPTINAYTGEGAPQAVATSVSASTSNANAGQQNHHLRISYGNSNTQAVDEVFSGYKVNRVNFNIPVSEIGNSTTKIRHAVVNDLGVASDYMAVSHVELKYAHTLNFEAQSQFHFIVPQNSSESKTLLNIDNVSGFTPIIYQVGQQVRRINPILVDGIYKALIPNTATETEFNCFFASNTGIKQITKIEPVANNGFFTNFGLANVDSAFIIVTNKKLSQSATAYRNYRQQRFNSFIAYVDELYDQFGFGVPNSGYAIRNFSNFLLNNWNSKPQYLLLLGKSVREPKEGNNNTSLAGSRHNPDYYQQNLVPSFGFPSSDNYITAGLANTTLQPAIKTGRISARNNEEAFDYLAKLQTFESQPPAEWMKNIMHFGGGGNLNEQQNFAYYLSVYEDIVEDTSFGGTVSTFLKSSSAPVQIDVSENIESLIEGGVSLMTFFGHASADGFDQTIDNPANFNWNGRFPMLLGNSCYTGDIHLPTNSSTSEQYTLLPNKGVIAFLSTVKLGFDLYLNIYSREFYRNLSVQNYGGTIGGHIEKTIEEIQFSAGPEPNLFLINVCFGMTLQGDPAIVLNSFPKPDLTVSEDKIFFEPAEITTDVDTFSVNIVLTNIGKATTDSFTVTLEHQPPETLSDSVYNLVVDGLLFKDTIEFKIPVDVQFGAGLHNFNVYVDLPQNEIEELPGFENSNNTVLGKQLLISGGGLIPVYPFNNSVVGNNSISLKASTGDPFALPANYTMQIDTTDYFNSPFLTEATFSQSGGVVEWQLPFSLQDSMVYYWRARKQDGSQEELWRNSAFQYIEDKTGWGQAHIFQFENNDFLQMEFNRPNREIIFNSGTVRITNHVIGNSVSMANTILYNTEVAEYGACGGTPSIHMAIFDPITFSFWETNYQGSAPQNSFGNANDNGACRPRPEKYFIFRQNNPAQMQALADVLNSDIIPEGHYVLLYTMRYVNYDGWQAAPELFSAFQNLGAQIIGTTAAQDSVPFSFLTRKGEPGFTTELYADSINQVLNLIADLPVSGNEGAMISEKIGPAADWKSFSWDLIDREGNSGDTTIFQLIGIRENGVEEVIESANYNQNQPQPVNIENIVNADTYPFLKIKATTSDPVSATPPNFRRWHILFEEYPEAALTAAEGLVFENELLQEGQNGKFAVAIKNISDLDMDSLLVSYWIEDRNRVPHLLEYSRQDSLKAGEILLDTIQFETLGFAGDNIFWVEANPINSQTGFYDQPEKHHFNNLGRLPFTVNSDNINPILDVTFDGLHILNGEIVSANPLISISLKDENEFLIMDELADTSNFKVFLKDPSASINQVFFSALNPDKAMQFIPATGAQKTAQIIYHPKLEMDGKYELLVQASDKSGNVSGKFDYEIEFEVINKSTITEVLNYPNPFTTRTQFVFTLTGSQIPDQIKIQIMTVTGKVVREIMQDEIGQIRIGRNRTDYFWDGRDEFGDRLANGVYLYRVVFKIHGENVELNPTAASKYFKKGFGKMYLMR